MLDKLEKEDARVLLQSTQQLRVHWSGIIITLMHYAIIVNRKWGQPLNRDIFCFRFIF